ncbi:tetratricopeptide repeat protein [Patescibacteria group bacterium]
MTQDKKDHVLETSSDFSDQSDIVIDSNEDDEIKKVVKTEKREVEKIVKPKKKVVGVVKRKWGKGLEFRKGVKKRINLKDKFSKKTEKTSSSTTTQSDTSKKKLDDLVKKEAESAPMISNSVVYPESKKIEMQREAVKKKQQEKREQLEEILVERIAQDPRDVDAYERLGDYYKEQGNNVDALSCYKYVLKLNPLNEKAKISIEEIKGLD